MNYKYDEELKGISPETRRSKIKWALLYLLLEFSVMGLCAAMVVLYGIDYDDFRTRRGEYKIQILLWLVIYGFLYTLFFMRRIIIIC